MSDMSLNRRNYYYLVKFLFALLVVMFPVSSETGVFPGGRIAFEGLFMLAGYLMMDEIQKSQAYKRTSGQDVMSFLWRKLSYILPFLIPSAVIAYLISAVYSQMGIVAFLKSFPMLFFEWLPLKTEGFLGTYYIGISWYLSAMLLAIMILYPFCRKYGSSFVLGVGIPIVLVIYGYCSSKYGHIGIAEEWTDYLPIKTGSLRGIAGCLLGCILNEAVCAISKFKLTKRGNVCAIVLETIGYGFFFFILQKYPRSEFDYLLIFVLFFLLLIGLSGLTNIGKKLGTINLQFMEAWSTLFILNHYYWINIIKRITAEIGTNHLFVFIYFLFIAVTSLIVWRIGILIQQLVRKCVLRYLEQ